MVAGDLNEDLDAELVVGYTLNGVAHLYQLDSMACSELKCMKVVGSNGYTVPTGRVSTTRSPELKLAIGAHPLSLSLRELLHMWVVMS
jgi:hypothetical protein